MEVFMKSLYVNLLISSLFLTPLFAVTDPYSNALLTLKSSLFDDSNTLNDWFLPSNNVSPNVNKIYACSWSGIACNENHTTVISIDLSSKNLGGEISSWEDFYLFSDVVDLNLSHNYFSGHFPVRVFNLTSLRSLDVSKNNFSGRFPVGISSLCNLVVFDAFSNGFIGQLPVDVSEIETIRVLNLAGSYFNGPIPLQYGGFKTIEFIHLAGNFLSGEIPAELGMLSTVKHMEIGYNSYRGGVPWELGNMSELQYLDIAGANLSGSIPRELGNFTKLQSLFLFRNQLTGVIPWEISKIVTLTDLDLSDNQLSGSIPGSFSQLKNLKLLSLMYNVMSGTVPDGIAELPLLDTLFLWSNLFSGPLPENLGKNSKLKWIDVSTNSFNGSIPLGICSGGVVSKLLLFSNNFTGNLSPALSSCSSLVRVRIEDNSFSGEIPFKFSQVPYLQYIDMSRNKFSGGIPSDISQASKLEFFSISINPDLGGVIPAQIWSLPLLQNFSANSCNISGNLPRFNSCKSISVIDLGKNNISGIFPENISNCKNLVRLDLAHNHLASYIPEDLATLPSLGVLDLSYNSFNGSIPENFATSSSLRLLNVSFNDISGSIPSKEVFKLMGTSAFIGNPKLCGEPLGPCESQDESRLRAPVILLICAGLILFISVSVLCIYYFQRGRRKGEWKMVSYTGLPRFTANDVLKSINSPESREMVQSLSFVVSKAVLPTGITVTVKRIEWEAKRMKVMTEFVSQMGNARNKNLIRLLGICYNQHQAYILYDYLPNGNLADQIRMKRDWASKYKIVMGITRGLHYLHHEFRPAIFHGDLKLSNIMLDENMEPQLGEFGFKFLVQVNKGLYPTNTSMIESGGYHNAIKDELHSDVYSFGELILEIVTNGRLANAGKIVQNKSKESLLREIYRDNDLQATTNSSKEEIKLVVEAALLCLRDRPSIEDVLKLLLRSSSYKNRHKSL